MIIFSERLKKSREIKGYSQKEIAEYLGISQPYYGRFEKNTGEPNLEMLSKISEKLNVTIDYLLGFDREAGVISRNITIADDVEIEVIVRKKERSPIPDQEN